MFRIVRMRNNPNIPLPMDIVFPEQGLGCDSKGSSSSSLWATGVYLVDIGKVDWRKSTSLSTRPFLWFATLPLALAPPCSNIWKHLLRCPFSRVFDNDLTISSVYVSVNLFVNIHIHCHSFQFYSTWCPGVSSNNGTPSHLAWFSTTNCLICLQFRHRCVFPNPVAARDRLRFACNGTSELSALHWILCRMNWKQWLSWPIFFLSASGSVTSPSLATV